MYGLSYLGATQWLAASATPPNLQCILPGLTGSDFLDGWTYQGGALVLGFNLMWSLAMLGLPEVLRAETTPEMTGGLQAIQGVVQDHWGALNTLPLAEVPALRHDIVAPYYREWLAHPQRDAFWESVTVESAHPRVHVPSLNLGGWYDLFIRGTLRNFTGMRENGATSRAREGQRLVIGPGPTAPSLAAAPATVCSAHQPPCSSTTSTSAGSTTG